MSTSDINITVEQTPLDINVSVQEKPSDIVLSIGGTGEFNDGDFNRVFDTKTTDDLAEGSTNKYDQEVVLTEGNNITITGSYPTFEIAAEDVGLSTHVSVDELRGAFLSAYSTHYKEFTRDVDGNVTNIDIWEDNTKATKLFSKVLGYTGDKVTSITTTNEISGDSITKTLAYTGDNVSSITEEVL